MRLNRVLLLAASINMAMLATVFTISCSGEDGKQGKDGCAIEKNADDNYEVYCDGQLKGTLVGTSNIGGPNGGGCVLSISNGHLWCGDEDVGSVGGGPGGPSIGGCSVAQEDLSNIYEQVVKCPGEEAIYTCSGVIFDPLKHVCHNGGSRGDAKDKDTYGDETQAGTLVALLDDAGDPIFVCGENEDKYNPNSQVCIKRNGKIVLENLCGNAINEDGSFCLKGSLDDNGKPVGDKVTPLCNGSEFTADQFCQTGSPDYIEKRCGDKKTFNDSKINGGTSCISGKVQTLCGNNASAPGMYYSDLESFCYRGTSTASTEFFKVRAFCGYNEKGTGIEWNGDEDENGKRIGKGCALTKSTQAEYCQGDEGSKYCDNGALVSQCSEGNVLPSAGEEVSYYNPKTEFCRKAVGATSTKKVEVAKKCGENAYAWDGVDYFCNTATNTVGQECGGKPFNGAFEFCRDNAIFAYCANERNTYDPANQFCSYNAKGEERIFDFCGAGAGSSTYNKGKWDWKYCIDDPNDDGKKLVRSCGKGEDVKSSASVCSPIICGTATESNNFAGASSSSKYIGVDGFCVNECGDNARLVIVEGTSSGSSAQSNGKCYSTSDCPIVNFGNTLCVNSCTQDNPLNIGGTACAESSDKCKFGNIDGIVNPSDKTKCCIVDKDDDKKCSTEALPSCASGQAIEVSGATDVVLKCVDKSGSSGCKGGWTVGRFCNAE